MREVSTVQATTLKRAAQLVGGLEQLASRLEVAPSHLALWVAATEPTPPNVFLKAVDVIQEHDRDDLGSVPNRPDDKTS